MAEDNNGVRLHKVMATTGSYPSGGGNFGVKPLSEVNGGRCMDTTDPGKTLDDGSRATKPHVGRGNGRMPATAAPDHGPHHHDNGR